jgi:RNA polymerase sigma-70 factor (ECF subfamily)
MLEPHLLNPETEERKRLVALLTRHQRELFAYLHALVPDRHDAEDLLQETNMVICEKFQEFQPGTDFVAWARQVAWWRVRAARQRFARSKLVFDDNVLEAVAQTAETISSETDARHEALQHCLGKLAHRDRELVLARYQHGHSVAEAAQQCGRSVEAAYKALQRLRKWLFDCMLDQLRLEGER